MEILAVILAIVIGFLVLKFISGVIKFAVLALIVGVVLYFLSQGGLG